MHIQIISSLAVLIATGLSANASPAPNPGPVPAPVALPVPVAAAFGHLDHLEMFPSRHAKRRLSRKMHLAPRHGHHHHSGTVTTTEYTTITSATGSHSGTTTVTEYMTITSSSDAPSPTTDDGSSSTTDDSATSTFSEEPSSTSSSPQPSSSTGATIVATGSPCGDPNGTADPTQTGGPNGLESWLNCGVDGDGWVPPPITLDNLVYKDLADVLQQDNSIFAACTPYLQYFEDMSASTGVPTIFLASIAIQESGCNPSVTGGAGEIGMMQITSEKCPTDGRDCFDAQTNIEIGANYFKTVLDQNNGNLAAAMGAYNGWYQGLTVALANNYAYCAQHNNLDYLQNVFNGLLHGVDPSSINMGIYHNTCNGDTQGVQPGSK